MRRVYAPLFLISITYQNVDKHTEFINNIKWNVFSHMCNIKFFGMLWMPNYAEHEDGSLMLLNISNIKTEKFNEAYRKRSGSKKFQVKIFRSIIFTWHPWCVRMTYYIEFDKFIFCEVDCEHTSMNISLNTILLVIML